MPLVELHPPRPSGSPLRLTIPADLSRLAEARAWIGEIACTASLGDTRSFDLQVAVSEATANAIEHAASGVELVAYLLPDRLIVEIVNDGVFQPGLYKDDEHRRRGLGLPLMVSLADQVHVSGLAQSRTRVSLTFFLESYSHWDSPPPGFVEGTELEATHREAEDRYRKLVDLSPDAILVNLSGTYVFANPAAAKLLGAGSPADLIGRSVLRHVHPDDRDLVAERTGQILSGAIAPPREIRLLRLDGTLVPADVTGSRVEFGGRLAVQAIMRDITERKRVEEEINDVSQLLAYHMEHSPLAVIEWGPDMRISRWSGEAERIFGWQADEVLGKRTEDFRWVHEDDLPQVSEVSEELQDGTNPRRFSINRNYHKDGSVVYCEWHNSSFLDESGNLKSILSLVLDVTERKRAEELLAASEERFRTMADAIPQLAWIAHADGSIYWYNKRWYEYTGTALAEMEGWGWQKVHDPQVLPAVLASWEVSIATGQPFSMEFPLRGVDGEFRPFLTYAMPLRDETGDVVQWFGTNTDISEQKRAEEARRKGEERLSGLLSSAGRLRLIERQNAWPVLLVGIVAQFALFFGVDQLGSPSHYLGLPGAATALIGVCAAVLAGPSLGVIVSLAGGLAYFVFLTDLGTAVAWAAIVVSILLWALASAAAGMAADFVRRNALLREKSLRRMLVERETLTQSLGQANESLLGLNRTLKAHSDSDQALIRATDEASYLQEVCRIIVEDCGHAMIWIGYKEDDEAKSIRPVASAGFEEGYLDTIKVTWADSERGRGPTGTAVRTGRPSICRDMLTDPAFAPWRDEALRRGYASSLALPLVHSGTALGAITIYASEPDPFSDDEVKLLADLTDDLALGITTLRLRAAHAETERERDILLAEEQQLTEELLATNEELQYQADELAAREEELQVQNEELRASRYNRTLIEASLDPLVTIGLDGTITDVNEATINITGRTREELLGTDFSDYFTDPESARMGYREAFAKGSVTDYPLTVRAYDGKLTDVLYNASVYKDQHGNVLGVFAAARDMTAVKELEEQRDIASTLQKALLDLPQELPGLRLAHLYRSATQKAVVGGDFYDVFKLKDGRIAILIGDVSGHGVEAARLATLVRDVIHVFAHQSTEPALVLKNTNNLLIEKETPGFVTVFLGILDPVTGLLVYTSAGHPNALLRSPSGEVELLQAASAPVGVFPDRSWEQNEAQLEKDDILFLYTDGAIEARRNGDFFGQEGLVKALGGWNDPSLELLPQTLLDQVLSFSGGELTDDVAMLALRLGDDGKILAVKG